MHKANSHKAQGALEYLLLIGGAVLIVAIILVIIIVSAHTMQCKAESNSIRAQMAQFEGLVGYWRFDEGTSLIKDYSYYENAGHIVSIAPIIASSGCPNDKRFSFSTGSNDSIRIEHLDTYYNPDGYTVTAWFKTSSDCSTNYCLIAKKAHVTAGGDHELKFGISGSNERLQLRSWLERPSVPGAVLDGVKDYDKSSVQTGQWYFGAAVFDGTNYDPPQIIVYLNGDGSTPGFEGCGGSCPAQAGDIVLDFSGPFYIGSDQGNNYQFHGEIDEVMFFNRPLSAGEIRRIYELTKKWYQ